jgi:hypothetical protein
MGASAQVNLSYIGQPATSALGGQIIADQNGGPLAKTLYGYGTILSGSTATSVAVGFIDGTQTFGNTFVLPLTQVKVDATTSTYADYYSFGPITRIAVGDVVAVTGFTNSGNNVTNLTVSSVNGSYFAASNSGVVAEVNSAATAVDTKGALPVWVNLFYAGNGSDSSTAAALFQTGTNKLSLGAVTTTGFTIYYPTVTTSAVTISFGAIIAFSS